MSGGTTFGGRAREAQLWDLFVSWANFPRPSVVIPSNLCWGNHGKSFQINDQKEREGLIFGFGRDFGSTHSNGARGGVLSNVAELQKRECSCFSHSHCLSIGYVPQGRNRCLMRWLWVKTLYPFEHQNRWQMDVHPPENGAIGVQVSCYSPYAIRMPSHPGYLAFQHVAMGQKPVPQTTSQSPLKSKPMGSHFGL